MKPNIKKAINIILRFLRITWVALWTPVELISLLILGLFSLLHMGIMYAKYWEHTRRILEDNYNPFKKIT